MAETIIFPRNTELWISPQSATPPDLVDAPGGDFRLVGCIDTFTLTGSTQRRQVRCHGKPDPVATFIQTSEKGLDVTVKDLKPENWALAFGGAEFLVSTADADATLLAQNAASTTRLSLLIRWESGQKDDPANPGEFIDCVYGFWVPNCEVSSEVTMDVGTADSPTEASIPVSFDLLTAAVVAAENPYGSPIVPRSNDPDWAALAAAGDPVI